MQNNIIWKDLCVSPKEMRLQHILNTGQSFSWKQCGILEWTGVIGKQIYHLKQTDKTTLYRCLFDGDITNKNKTKLLQNKAHKDVLFKYFNLHISLSPLIDKWCTYDSTFQNLNEFLSGLRAIQQDPIECLFSFICSANNNIPRITSMIDKLRIHYGEYLTCTEIPIFKKINTKNEKLDIKLYTKTNFYTHKWHAFPSLHALANIQEDDLRKLGFGYRSKSICKTAQQLIELGGDEWLSNLKLLSHKLCQENLLKLTGVGRKVADCVALYSLNQTEAIPVDTHIWKIACKKYAKLDPSLLTKKSLTTTIYQRITNLVQNQYSPYAGWAQCYLFSSQLSQYGYYKDIKLKVEEEDSIDNLIN